MAGAKPPEPPEGVAAPLTSPEEVSTAWDQFRGGGIALCPADGGPLALAVEGTANVYRFVCVRCGCASAWFEAGAGGPMMRGPRATPPEAGD